MQTFPVSSSLLSAPHIAGFVHAAYGLEGSATARIIRSGINDTYRIDCGDERYVFRVYSLDWRTKTEIFEEIRLLEFLHGHGMAVSYPIRNSEGHYLNELPAPEGKRFAVLFSFAPGKKQGSLPEDVHRHTGETMAKLHLLTERFALQRSTYTPENLIRGPLKELAAFLPAGTEELQYIHILGNKLLGILASGTGSLPRGAIHFDLWFDNMNVAEDNSVTVFDFDFCGNGWLCHDVAYYQLQLHNVERDPETCRAKLNAFLQGYESIRPLSEDERHILPALGLTSYFFYLGVQCRRFDNWSNGFLSEEYLRRYIVALVKRYAELHGL